MADGWLFMIILSTSLQFAFPMACFGGLYGVHKRRGCSLNAPGAG